MMNEEQEPVTCQPADCPRRRCQRRRAACDGTGPHCSADSTVAVGAALRTLREQRQLSIKALAELSGLAVNTLSLIENGKTSPSVSTLQQLAHTLHVPITAFFEPAPAVSPVVYLPASQRTPVAFDQGLLEDLRLGLTDCPVEPFLVTLAAGASTRCNAVTHPGYEFVFCLTGQIAYTIQEQVYRLQPGDSLLFEAALPHCWENLHATEAHMLVMFCPARERPRRMNLHFSL